MLALTAVYPHPGCAHFLLTPGMPQSLRNTTLSSHLPFHSPKNHTTRTRRTTSALQALTIHESLVRSPASSTRLCLRLCLTHWQWQVMMVIQFRLPAAPYPPLPHAVYKDL